LMGNSRALELNEDQSVDVDVSPIPFFLVSENVGLIKTLLSLELVRRDLSASVRLQNQTVSIQNHFGEQVKFDFDVIYPDDWIVLENVFSYELKAGEIKAHPLRLSPSSLSDLGDVGVTSELSLSLEKNHYFVKIYRRDLLSSDVTIDLKFFRAKGGLQLDLSLGLAGSALSPSSFTAAAIFPNGDHLEAFFKSVVPGGSSLDSVFVRDGESMVGKQVSIEITERGGSRYINRSFPIKVSY
ncbi:MAG: hypothetical protein HQL31_01125, partial [Planctomycetes bacterium]|nr:hypothetical protein [Planctomycetota bacterium]